MGWGGGGGVGGSTGVQCWWDPLEELAPSEREREREEKSIEKLPGRNFKSRVKTDRCLPESMMCG